MRTLALRGGVRVPVVAAEWRDAFAVVTRGRVQLELRDGVPGPVLGREAGFWLRGTGVRALRNPGRRTATVHIVSPSSRQTDDGGTMTSSQQSRTAPTRPASRVVSVGLAATLAAMAATTLVAALARAAGVDLEVDGGEAIPLSGITVVTGLFSVVGVGLAVALLRWSARPVERFVRTTVVLTAISLVPPLLAAASTAAAITLVALHLVAAGVVVPVLARELRRWGG